MRYRICATKKVSEESKTNMSLALTMGKKNMWLPLYYSSEKDSVYTTSGGDRQLVTHLLNPCTPDEIKEIVTEWKWR